MRILGNGELQSAGLGAYIILDTCKLSCISEWFKYGLTACGRTVREDRDFKSAPGVHSLLHMGTAAMKIRDREIA